MEEREGFYAQSPEPFTPEELERLRRAFEHSRSRYKNAQQLAAPAVFEEWMGLEPGALTPPRREDK